MNTRKLSLKTIPIIILTTNMIFLCNNFALAFNLKEYYPLEQGNSWTYVISDEKNIVEENTIAVDNTELFNRIKVTKITASTEEDEYTYTAIDSQGIKEYKVLDDNTSYIYTPPRLLFPNIEIGKSIEYSTNLMRANDNSIKEIDAGIITLDSIEDIEVSAGKFKDCLKFTKNYSNKEEDGNKCKTYDCSIWLAPNIGKIKEFCIETKKDNNTFHFKLLELKSAIINGKEIKNY
ncbi:MAG: hypothetical protein ABIH18_06865 [Candidatus Omnitrophota bacterium]